MYTSKWPFFNALHFLRDNITTGKTASTSTIDEAADSLINTDMIGHEEKQDRLTASEESTPSKDVCIFNTSNFPLQSQNEKQRGSWRMTYCQLVCKS